MKAENAFAENFQVSVSSKGHVWAVDMENKIWWRKGADNNTALGTRVKASPLIAITRTLGNNKSSLICALKRKWK